MNPLIIVVIVLALALIAFGVVALVPFGGKKLLCPAGISGNVADSSNCSIMGYISESNCPDAKVEYLTTPSTAASCKPFVDAKESEVTGIHDEKWCKTKYATLNTETNLCKNYRSNIVSLVTNLATTFNMYRLIKQIDGSTLKFYLARTRTGGDPLPNTANLQDPTKLSTELSITTKYEQVNQITETTSSKAVSDTIVGYSGMFGAIRAVVDNYYTDGWDIEPLVGEIATIIGLMNGLVKMVNQTSVQPVSKKLFNADFSSMFKNVGTSAYSYLDLTPENQAKLIAALADTTNPRTEFGRLCAL